MEQALGPIVSALLKMGAPWVITAIFVVLFAAERKKKDELSDKLYDLGVAGIKKDMEVHATLNIVCRDLEELRRQK